MSYWQFSELENMALLNGVILQKDGAPAHYAADASV
jgi:hypothetical protein